MARISRHNFKTADRQGAQYWFWCPGCDCAHAYTVPPWTFDGDMEKPTFRPSLLCNASRPESRCHLVMTKGLIAFCGDCWHDKKGQTMELPELPGWLA